MSKNKIFRYFARTLSVVLICFVSLFALDVFGEPHWFLALLIHLIPSYFLILFAVIAWKNELIGGLLYLVSGSIFLALNNFRAGLIFLPAIFIGFIYLLSFFQTKKS